MRSNKNKPFVVITLINIPKFERNSQQDLTYDIIEFGCNYFDKYTKIWKELTTAEEFFSILERL